MSEETKETSESKPVAHTEEAKETVRVAISERRKAGDEGIFIQPTFNYETDPFAAQDVDFTADNGPSSPEEPAPENTDSSSSSTPEGSTTEGE